MVNPFVAHECLLPAFCREGDALQRISSTIALSLTSKELYQIIQKPYMRAFIDQIKIREFGSMPLGLQLVSLKSWKKNKPKQTHLEIISHSSYSVLGNKLISFGEKIAWAPIDKEHKFTPIGLPDLLQYHFRERNFVAESSHYIALNQGFNGVIYVFSPTFDFIHKWTLDDCLSQLEIHEDKLYARTERALFIFSLNDLMALPKQITLPYAIRDAIFCFGKTYVLYAIKLRENEVKLGYILYNGEVDECPEIMNMSFVQLFSDENDFLVVSESHSRIYLTKLTLRENRIKAHHIKSTCLTQDQNHKLKAVFYHLERVFAAYEVPGYKYALYSYDLDTRIKRLLSLSEECAMANSYFTPHFILATATDIRFAMMILSHTPTPNQSLLSIETLSYA